MKALIVSVTSGFANDSTHLGVTLTVEFWTFTTGWDHVDAQVSAVFALTASKHQLESAIDAAVVAYAQANLGAGWADFSDADIISFVGVSVG